MNIRPTFITNPQAPVLAEPGEGTFHHPAVDAQATPMLGPASRQEGDNAPVSQPVSMPLRVIGAIPQTRLGTPTRPSHFTRDGRDGIDQRQQLRHVMAVRPSDLERQGDPVRRGQEMILSSSFALFEG